MALSNGQHLIIDLYGCDPEVLWDKATMERILNDLPEMIGMSLLEKARVKECHPNDTLIKKIKRFLGLIDVDINSGLTGTVLLWESHIAFHSFPERDGFCYFDVFSCKEFDKDIVLRCLMEELSPAEFPHAVLSRGSGFND